MDEKEGREAVCAAGRELVETGSSREPGETYPSGFRNRRWRSARAVFDYLLMRPDDVVIVDLATGRRKEGSPPRKRAPQANLPSRSEVEGDSSYTLDERLDCSRREEGDPSHP